MISSTSFVSAHTIDPVANPDAIVIRGDVRFTILTSQMIRMEWAPEATFEDSASFVFINRNLPVCPYTVEENDDWLIIRTEKLLLKYKIGSGEFKEDNLSIELELNGRQIRWQPGMEDTGNLRGTNRTLDRAEGAVEIEPGILSRDGWTIVDDSERPLLAEDGDWAWIKARPQRNRQDLYFFGYGHNYRQALYDYTLVAGKIPMPPRFVFGFWWSRYWPYTEEEMRNLVKEFQIHNVPVDVLVVDMDWHTTFLKDWWKKEKDQAGERKGWTGFTWNKTLFPSPKAFLDWTRKKDLKVTLNLHPASGIQPHEEAYPAVAKAMGIDPESQKYVPFDIVDKKFAQAYLDLVLRPLEEEGVDFWWLDWQQWSTTNIPGMSPTMWLNYVHYADMERQGKVRPLIFHRWGGLGNHRYPIGFSGDSVCVWKSLDFQPYFTATAANVGCAYWSHDIGGHMPGPISPELFLRWLQFGAFSPVLRTHTSKNANAERRVWAYPHEYFLMMRDVILLRYALIPYIYTEARKTYETGVAFMRPMYYDYPEAEEAYTFTQQYMFGDNMIVAPVTESVSDYNRLAKQRIWLPEGTWVEWHSGQYFVGSKVIERHFDLDEIPLYVKAGSIIPMMSTQKITPVAEKPLEHLVLTVLPARHGDTRLYEDEYNTNGYLEGHYTWTSISQHMPDDDTLIIRINPVEGRYTSSPSERSYQIHVRGILPPKAIYCNQNEVPYEFMEEDVDSVDFHWQYEGNQIATIITLDKLSVHEPVEVVLKLQPIDNLDLLNGVQGKISRLKKVMHLLNKHATKTKDWSPDFLVEAAQAGNRMSLRPETVMQELLKIEDIVPKVIQEIYPVEGDSGVEKLAVLQLKTLLKYDSGLFAPRKG
ncbi:glycoside hydrolase family 31 protein [Cytophagaceae bacterium YF14B1]|uniref:Glycoside hydrolase family 31 protein n=1 Tax=Xanthocytophaga flava TaxID=3048013 RepID=A0AAE3U7E6_9BACT|nr:TIM-barrel domain-containing protein [Xanthocytophaga flavus]MDJ1480033.1 glycoside hydrolase family 31 protein [Xanthocytophaga flavus]